MKSAMQMIKDLQTKNERLKECLNEAVELMEDVENGNYTPDSFTTQPWKVELKESS